MDQRETKKKRGGCLKVALIVVLVLALVTAAAVFIWYKAHEDEIKELSNECHTVTFVGQTMPDFEVTTTDGEEVSLSSLMDGKEVTVVVLFATWCGPCEREFPEMDEVYKKYQDRMSLIALDIDSLDDEKSAKEYADSHGFSFPVAFHDGNIGDIRAAGGYPTILLIDRNGKIGMHRAGAVSDAETFESIVTRFMGDDYKETQLGYYTFTAYSGEDIAAGTEFEVTSETGAENYMIGENGSCNVFTDRPEDLKVRVISVPDGWKTGGDGGIQTGIGSTLIPLPVRKK